MIEEGFHTLEGGARLIAGEAHLGVQQTLETSFDSLVQTDDSGAAFDRPPALLCTVQERKTGHVGVRASCAAASVAGFSL